MSDDAASVHLFNSNVEKLMNEAKAAYSNNEEEEGDLAVKVLNLHCGLHVLVHAAETVVAATVTAKECHFDGAPPIHDPKFLRANQSGAARLVETASNALDRGGDAKNGAYGKFLSDVQPTLRAQFGCRALPLPPYKGNRFSILFHNSSVIYALRQPMTNFL